MLDILRTYTRCVELALSVMDEVGFEGKDAINKVIGKIVKEARLKEQAFSEEQEELYNWLQNNPGQPKEINKNG